MPFPKLKNALLCRILVYMVVIGAFALPVVAVALTGFFSGAVVFCLAMLAIVGFLVYLVKNVLFLEILDIFFATLHAHNRARRYFSLRPGFTPEKLERSVSFFGKRYDPSYSLPKPGAVRYKSERPLTVYTSGIEKVVLTYRAAELDKTQYRQIVRSATANSNALRGRKKYWLDKQQQKAPLNRVTVIFILADRIEETLRGKLLSVVCKEAGDGIDTAILPCVIDLENRRCVFDSLRIPYIGFQYAVKNRGIKLIRKLVFHGRFPYSTSPEGLDPIKAPDSNQDTDLELDLWSFWRQVKWELVEKEKSEKRHFEKMNHRDMDVVDGFICLKWMEHGVVLSFEKDEERRTVAVEPLCYWTYPKAHKIAKGAMMGITEMINSYFAGLGYSVTYSEAKDGE